MHTLILLLALGQCPGGVCPPTRSYVPLRSYAPPTIWQLADNSGTIWVHSDLGYLRQWVAMQNVPRIEDVVFRFH